MELRQLEARLWRELSNNGTATLVGGARGRQGERPAEPSCRTRPTCLPDRLILVRPVGTRKVRRALEQLGCTLVGTKGDHEKWRTPNGLTTTIVAGEKQQSPGLLRSVQRVFEPEFGEGWLEKEVG